jgi:streptomycin 6-kinase
MNFDPKIPEEVSACAAQLALDWGFTPIRRLSGATCSLVLLVSDPGGSEVVLKVPFPDAEEKDAFRTLVAFSGHGGIEVLRHDEPSGAVLMPMIRPGFTLNELEDEEATVACAEIILNLRKAPLVQAGNIRSWFDEIVDRDEFGREARNIAKELLASTTSEVLLHGDLHQGNILRQDEAWVVIDPKGILGDPAFEITGFMRNSTGEISPGKMRKRLKIFAEILGDPIERLWAFAFVQTVVSYQGDEGRFFHPSAEAIWAARP